MMLRITCIGRLFLQVFYRWFYKKKIIKPENRNKFFIAKLCFSLYEFLHTQAFWVYVSLKFYFTTYKCVYVSFKDCSCIAHFRKFIFMITLFVKIYCMNFQDSYSVKNRLQEFSLQRINVQALLFWLSCRVWLENGLY